LNAIYGADVAAEVAATEASGAQQAAISEPDNLVDLQAKRSAEQ
jgi:hypothetical protein